MAEVEAELVRRLDRGEEVVLATVVRVDGGPPSRPGAKALLTRDTALAGTLGCSEFDAAALADGPSLLDAGEPRLATYRHDLGSVEVYLEPYLALPSLVVVSATPVATHLLPWASEVGFRTVLVEPRSERLREGSWAALADTVVESEAELEVRGELFVVCTDHDAPHLVELLEALLRRGPRHVAVMGSARHTGHHLEALRARGLPDGDVARIESPAGLSIGSRTPAEIAISILAGLIAFRHGAAPAR